MTAQPGDYEDRKGTYTGPLPLLKGKTAELICYPSGQCLATFHDVATGYGFGLHAFSTSNFELDTPVDWDQGQGLA